MPNIKKDTMIHVVNTQTKDWYHIDEDYKVWTCGCKENGIISLCLTLNEELKAEGIINELNRKIAAKRKELGFYEGK